jgi:hypothetical protein
VNGAARPSEHCSKQSSDSPMPPQRNAFRRRDVRQQSESFAGCNQSLGRSPNSNPLYSIDVSADFIGVFGKKPCDQLFAGLSTE